MHLHFLTFPVRWISDIINLCGVFYLRYVAFSIERASADNSGRYKREKIFFKWTIYFQNTVW